MHRFPSTVHLDTIAPMSGQLLIAAQASLGPLLIPYALIWEVRCYWEGFNRKHAIRFQKDFVNQDTNVNYLHMMAITIVALLIVC